MIPLTTTMSAVVRAHIETMAKERRIGLLSLECQYQFRMSVSYLTSQEGTNDGASGPSVG